MIVYQAALSRDTRIMLDGKIGGYRVESILKITSEAEVVPTVSVQWYSDLKNVPLLVIPIASTDAHLRRGTIQNPRKLLAHYFEERRHG